MKAQRQHRLSYMAKRFVMFFALACILVSPKGIGKAEAQVFIMDEEEFMQSDRGIAYNPGMIPIPPQGEQTDWIYAPLGDGLVPLLGLGMAFLLSKRRKKDDE